MSEGGRSESKITYWDKGKERGGKTRGEQALAVSQVWSDSGNQGGIPTMQPLLWDAAISALRAVWEQQEAAGRRESVPAVNKRQPWLNGSGNELKMVTKSGGLPLRRGGGMTPVPHVHQNSARTDTFVINSSRCWVEISLNQNRGSMGMTVFPTCASAHSLQWMKYPGISKLSRGPAGHQVPPAARFWGLCSDTVYVSWFGTK